MENESPPTPFATPPESPLDSPFHSAQQTLSPSPGSLSKALEALDLDPSPEFVTQATAELGNPFQPPPPKTRTKTIPKTTTIPQTQTTGNPTTPSQPMYALTPEEQDTLEALLGEYWTINMDMDPNSVTAPLRQRRRCCCGRGLEFGRGLGRGPGHGLGHGGEVRDDSDSNPDPVRVSLKTAADYERYAARKRMAFSVWDVEGWNGLGSDRLGGRDSGVRDGGGGMGGMLMM